MLPKTSRIWIYRFPFGYAACATRTVSWGTGQIACGFSDINTLLWAILHLLFLPFLASLFLYRQGLRDSPAVSRVYKNHFYRTNDNSIFLFCHQSARCKGKGYASQCNSTRPFFATSHETTFAMASSWKGRDT